MAEIGENRIPGCNYRTEIQGTKKPPQKRRFEKTQNLEETAMTSVVLWYVTFSTSLIVWSKLS